MHDARTKAVREVDLLPFELGRVPVTAEQWRAVSGELPGADSPPRPQAPVCSVTWFEAVRWCNMASAAAGLSPAYKLNERIVAWNPGADGFRLPTEAEWEFACRSETAGPLYGELSTIAWTAVDKVDGPQDVALKEANGFGLYDTIGNVWEWCWNYADTARYADYRSLRGGGWADPAWSCRASVRRGSAPDAVLEDVGFRVARGPAGELGALSAQGWSAATDRLRAAIRGPLPVGWTPLRGLSKET